MTNRKQVKQAFEHVAAIKGFYWHLAAFVSVVTGLLVINALTEGDWWVQWVFFGWGVGIVAHALAVFGGKPQFVRRWEQKKVRQLVER